MDFVDLAVVDLIRRHQTQTGMVMRLIIPGEEFPAELSGIFDTAETFREPWLIFQGFEVAFGKGVVIRDMWAAVRFGDAEIGKQEGGRLCPHWPAAVGMQGELAGWHVMLGDGVVKQSREQGSTFSIGDAPADNASAEDIQDDVKIEIGPFRGSLEFGDVPRPDFIWPHRQQFRLGIDGMAELLAARANFVVGMEDPIQGAHRAMVGALVEQSGVDFGRGLIDKAGRPKQIEHGLPRPRRQRAGWARPADRQRRR